MQIEDAVDGAVSVAGVADLGPLAWVIDELRKSLEVANKSLKRYVRDAEAARGTDLASVDASQLRMARQHMHQAVGALEMVGLLAPAHMLRAMEAAVQQFVQRPERCNEASAALLERASFALLEYLDVIMGGVQESAVGLFPQYRDAQVLAGAERIHPADLWPVEWRWIRPDVVLDGAVSLAGDGSDRGRMDQAVLRLMQKGDTTAAAELRDLSLAVAKLDPQGAEGVFWILCSGFFEAVASGSLPVDLYVKRAASQVLMQFAAGPRGERHVSERMAKELLFFCAQALPETGTKTRYLEAVRKAYDLGRFGPVDYESRRYGRFDPAVVAQARKRIEAVKEAWSALAGGDVVRLKNIVDQFGLVADSIIKLHPRSERLAGGLKHAAEVTQRSGKAPAAEVALEVATAVLYLEAALTDRNQDEHELAQRTDRLAERLEQVCGGNSAQPLEAWMEELYRRVSDRQTMGTVVGELRATLSEAEKALDQFFRNPDDATALTPVPGLLAQMRGVLSVLGLDQASQAVVSMRDNVEEMLVTKVDVELAPMAGTFDRLGNNLGALGLLIDMLNYQPALAKKLFVFDPELGELRPVMGRATTNGTIGLPASDHPVLPVSQETTRDGQGAASQYLGDASAVSLGPDWALDLALPGPIPDEVRELARQELGTVEGVLPDMGLAPMAVEPSQGSGQEAPQVEVTEIDEDDLQDIFLEEANEVIANGLEALDLLAIDPHDLTQQTTLRRAFHTLKGSSRMVGLMEFGEAAWSLEQLLNAWLSEQKPASPDLCGLSREALLAFQTWVGDISQATASHWSAAVFRTAADALRKDNIRLPLELQPGAPTELVEVPQVEVDPGTAALEEMPDEEFSESTDLAPMVEESIPAETLPLEEPDLAGYLDSTASGPLGPVDVPGAQEIVSIEVDFDSLAELVPVSTTQAEGGVVEPLVAMEEIPLAEPERDLAPPVSDMVEEEQIKVIGSLRIGIPLYNVYLNEADEWSRRLSNQLSEWSLEVHRPVPSDAEALAHSLAGSSATVGFSSLSDMARALEHALQHMGGQHGGTDHQGRVFREAAEDIRRLLHQFAAGFLKEPNPFILEELRALEFGDAVSASQVVEAPVFPLDPAQTLAAPLVEDMQPVAPTAESFAEPAVSDSLHDDVLDATMPVEGVEPAPVPVPVEVRPPDVLPVAEIFAQRAFEGQTSETDDIDLVDVLDPDLFPIFEEEAGELLPQLGGALRQWSARPENMTARGEVLRALHTLKGSARLAGALQLGEMAHRMESEIEAIGSGDIHGEDVAPLMARLDAIEGKFEALRKINLQTFMPELLEPMASALVQEAPVFAAPGTEEAPVERGVIAQPSPMLVAPVRAAANQVVRVRAQLLDRMVNQAGEVMITRSRLEAEMTQLRESLQDLTGNLDRLRHQLRDIELQAESQMQSRMAQAKDSQQNFDPLEFDRFTRVQELTRMMAESVNDVATVQRNLQRTVDATEDDLVAQARQTRALQQDLLRTRMMEFEGISERLYRVVRQASKDTAKQVKLDINGGSIEMDRGVLDRMTAAFEHLLRNCVVHGIEDPTVRSSAGKESVGTITIDLQQAGNDVSVSFTDDGAGLDLPRILEKAIQHGLVPADQTLSDEEVASLVFMPGFTTVTEVTELAGRGIGMDVVRSEVQALGGRIETSTQQGRGTSFKLVLPLTTAVTQVVVMRSGTISLGVPANLVELVRRVTARELQQAYSDGFIDFAGESVPFFWSGALLQSSAHSVEPAAKTMPIVVFRSASQRVAVHLDEILGNQEAVVKNLGPQLSRLPGLAGMTVLASGAVILIYNPVALAAVYGEQARQLSGSSGRPSEGATSDTGAAAPALSAPVSEVPLILVVDDSITVRRVTQRLLQREGYRVALAADGLQALERLQDERPAVVLSDIEMPRMDGFDLARNIRADARLKMLPIIMITSRIAEKHREHATALGVNHYLGKPYSEEELLSLVRRYTQEIVSA
jgi:chemosensory pili system protein ChpA (sensor histidine kinase/response regulator)